MSALDDLFYSADSSGFVNASRHNCYIKHPRKISTLEDAAYYDKIAAEEIEHIKNKIDLLNSYRAELFKRYQEIDTASYKMQLSIKRERFSRYGSNDRISYFVTVEKIFNRSDIHPQTIIQEKYPGRERHKALKRFEELKKQYAGIEAVKDVDKKSWER